MAGMLKTRASSPCFAAPLRGSTPRGMLSPSAKVVTLRARPSAPKSSSTLTVSRALRPGGAGYGYSMVSVTQSRPRSSKARFIGFWGSRSGGARSMSKPGGGGKGFFFSARERGSGGAERGGGGFLGGGRAD